VEAGEGHSNTLLAQLPAAMEERDRSLATSLVYGVLRRRLNLDRLIGRVSDRPPPEIDTTLLAAMRLALFQVLYLTRVPRAAAVNESVRLVRVRRGRAAASFVNAVLRAACRSLDGGVDEPWPRPGRESDPAALLAEKHSFPRFLVDRFLARYGPEECDLLLETMNQPAPVVLRLTGRSAGVSAVSELLEKEGVLTRPSPILPGSLRVLKGVPQRTACWREGQLYIQDEASQIVALLLLPILQGDGLVDLCAAPGGKILQIADGLPGGVGPLVAADLSRERLRGLEENMRRLAIGGLARLVMDATRPALRSQFRRVLLDAPCSGTGIIRRHPEIRWRRGEDDINTYAKRQAQALEAAAGLVAAGGRLVYAVCSLEPEEGPERVASFLVSRPDFHAVDARGILPPAAHGLVNAGGFLVTLPHRDDIDGFFAAVLERR
jgi:16S rRNA (cytosine967-C5)-methyltransferase